MAERDPMTGDTVDRRALISQMRASPYEAGGVTGGTAGPVVATDPAPADAPDFPQAGGETGAKPALELPKGASGPEAAQYLLKNGMKGKELTDYLRAQGYQDNGLYYDNNGMYGFSDAYIGPDGNIVKRTPEAPQQQGPMAQGGGLDLSSGGVPTDSGFFQRILAQLQQQAGPASTDRSALLSLLGQGQG